LNAEEFDQLKEGSRLALIRTLPTMNLWGGNPVPRGDIRGSYRIAVESPMGHPIIECNSFVEDLRLRNKGVPERILR
jgi:hypothetical protein